MSGAVLASVALAGGLSVRLTPPVIIGVGDGTVTTNQAFVGTVTGATGPIVPSWSASDPSFYPANPGSTTSFWRRDGVLPGELYSTTVTLIVTDSVTGQSASASGTVNISGL